MFVFHRKFCTIEWVSYTILANADKNVTNVEREYDNTENKNKIVERHISQNS